MMHHLGVQTIDGSSTNSTVCCQTEQPLVDTPPRCMSIVDCESRGTQTHDFCELNKFPRSTQTDSATISMATNDGNCEASIIDVHTQTDTQLSHSPGVHDRCEQTEFLACNGIDKRQHFLLPNLISGTLLALAGTKSPMN